MKQKSYERIKNFSTSIPTERTVMEIERMLGKFGASKIMKEFDSDGNPNLLAFMILTKDNGEIAVKLPINYPKILEVFKNQVEAKKLPKSYRGNKEQAYKVGWRIIKDWLEAQLTLISLEQVKIEEIFLPYIYNFNSGKTMFEVIEQQGFQVPQIEDKNIVEVVQE